MLDKGVKPVAEHLAEVKSMVNALSIAGDKTEDRDVVLFTMAGLGDEYDTFVQNVASRENDITFVQLQGRLSDWCICFRYSMVS